MAGPLPLRPQQPLTPRMLRRLVVVLVLVLLPAIGAQAGKSAISRIPLQPTHLQVNYQRTPALGVGPALRFSWAVPPGSSSSGVQASYRIVIREVQGNKVAWDSGGSLLSPVP